MKNKWFLQLIRKRAVMVVLILLQVMLMLYAIVSGSLAYKALDISFRLISLFVCLYIVSKNNNSAFKLSWIFIIMLLPVFGGLFYVFFNFQTTTKKFSNRIEELKKKAGKLNYSSKSHYNNAVNEFKDHTNLISYLENHALFPVFPNTQSIYLSPGEEKHKQLINELNKAERYIFMEYFIIQQGKMWDEILEVLKRKAADGVKVRIMYDDMGCFIMLPKNYPERLRELGIECVIFNPFKPILTSIQNNRDHRKIVCIDGTVAFTGGINITDYYINRYEKYGHWKDASIMIKGQGAWQFALMFLQMWELCTLADEDYSMNLPSIQNENIKGSGGYVQPYADCPTDKEKVCENVYLSIINNAKKYVYINTPYLIIDNNMLSALCLAAKSGVDVRIVTPHIWDKWAIHITTRSYYKELISSGVKVYEYTPGFIHSKIFLSDDAVGTVGSANLDFRSLYLHFECGAVVYGTNAICQMKNDCLKTFALSKEITLKDCKCGIFMRLLTTVMRLIAPLL